MQDTIRVRYFDSFIDGEPYILLSSNSSSVHRLEYLFNRLASGEPDRLELTSLDFIQAYFGISIFTSLRERDTGIEKDGKAFEWAVSPQTWESFADKLSAFHDGSSGHQYLGFPFDHSVVKIMVSVNEYSDDWIAWKVE